MFYFNSKSLCACLGIFQSLKLIHVGLAYGSRYNQGHGGLVLVTTAEAGFTAAVESASAPGDSGLTGEDSLTLKILIDSNFVKVCPSHLFCFKLFCNSHFLLSVAMSVSNQLLNMPLEFLFKSD